MFSSLIPPPRSRGGQGVGFVALLACALCVAGSVLLWVVIEKLRANPIIAETTPGLETNKWGYITIDEETGATNLPGVYAAGDIAAQPDVEAVNLIATGFAQVTIAVNVAATYLNPKAKVFPGHSSERRL